MMHIVPYVYVDNEKELLDDLNRKDSISSNELESYLKLPKIYAMKQLSDALLYKCQDDDDLLMQLLVQPLSFSKFNDYWTQRSYGEKYLHPTISCVEEWIVFRKKYTITPIKLRVIPEPTRFHSESICYFERLDRPYDDRISIEELSRCVTPYLLYQPNSCIADLSMSTMDIRNALLDAYEYNGENLFYNGGAVPSTINANLYEITNAPYYYWKVRAYALERIFYTDSKRAREIKEILNTKASCHDDYGVASYISDL